MPEAEGRARPLIVTATLGPSDFAMLDALRRAHFRPARNQLDAHLTMFHALPPSVEQEVAALLAATAQGKRPAARLSRIFDLGGGTAFAVESDALHAMRALIADRFQGCLTSQDAASWRPHVTIQNKVARSEALALQQQLGAAFRPKPLTISGLALYRYLGGPWEGVGRWSFRG